MHAAEEVNTPTLDAATVDLNDTAAAGTVVQAVPPAAAAAAAVVQGSRVAAAQPGSSSSSSSNMSPLGLPRRLWSRPQQQQQSPEAAAAVADPAVVEAVPETLPGLDSDISSSSSSEGAAKTAAGGVANIGLVMQLQGNWVAYQLAQMGKVAMAPLTSAKRAVSFLARLSAMHTLASLIWVTAKPLDLSLDPVRGDTSLISLAGFNCVIPSLISDIRVILYCCCCCYCR